MSKNAVDTAFSYEKRFPSFETLLKEFVLPFIVKERKGSFGEQVYLVYSNNDVDFSKLELKNGDVLFNRTNSPEWVGKTAIFRNHKTPCIFAGYLIRINQSEQIIGAYLNYFLNSSCARKQGNEVVSLAVNQANISGAKLSDYFIPIPPLLEQHRIVEKLDALLKLV